MRLDDFLDAVHWRGHGRPPDPNRWVEEFANTVSTNMLGSIG